MGNFWLQWLQRQVRGSSAAVELGALEVVLEGAGVVDLESLLLLELDEAWLSAALDDMMGEVRAVNDRAICEVGISGVV